jgi:hypothetical protein
LQVVGDGDPHSIIWPEAVRPSTPTDLLEQSLARDDAARSATTCSAISAIPRPGSLMPLGDTLTHSMWPPKVWLAHMWWRLWSELRSVISCQNVLLTQGG